MGLRGLRGANARAWWGDADLRPIPLDAVDDLVTADVGHRHVAQHGHRVAPRAVARRARAEHVRLGGVHVRLVDGDPLVDEVVERPHGRLRIAQESRRRFIGGEAAAPSEPERIDEVMERHQRTNPLVPQVGNLLTVAIQHRMVELPRPRFDTRPLHADASDGQTQRRHELVVLPPPVPVVGGAQRGRTIGDVAGLAGPIEPVVVLVTALDLPGGRRRADQQTPQIDVVMQRLRERRRARLRMESSVIGRHIG